MTRTMKDSGVEWIGQIPERWKIIRNKYLMTKEKIIKQVYEQEPILSLTMNGVIKRNLDNPTGKMPTTFDGYQILKPDNLLMCLFDIDVTPRCIGIINEYGLSSPAYSQFVLNIKLNTKYAYYYYLNLDFTKELLHLAKNLRHSLTEEQLGYVPVPLPPLPEQQAIADYLDDKCAQIDNITATINEQLEVLKQYKKSVITKAVTKGLDPNSPMKDSGVEWIGQIPEKWSISKMYLIADYKKGPFGSAITKNMFIDPTEEKAYKVYEQKNAIKKSADIGYYYISEEKFLSLKEFSIKPKDIIVSCAGTIGECFLLPEKCEEGIINQALMRIRLSKNIVSQYFLYLFSNSLDYLSEKYSNGSAIKNIPPFIILKKAKIPFPPLPEQQAIADYLDDKCAQIDAVIADKQAQLETLAAYKKSLIYEYVTGKKSVPGFEEA